MTAIDAFVRQPAAQAIAWALIQFVWQGAALGAVAALALALLRRSAADVRYVVSAIALTLMLTLPVVTAVQRYQGEGRASAAAGILTPREAAASPSASAPGPLPVTDRMRPPQSATLGAAPVRGIPVAPVVPVLLVIWAAGVTLLSLRLLTAWLWVQRLRTHGVSPVECSWEHVAARLARQLHITRRIALLESSRVDVPTVAGWLKPVVLLPGAALAGLAPDQLEAILAHELAHIRRHDYLVNLLQTLVETLLFYHPAVWWLSRRIRIEREHCCDDLAVRLCGDPIRYANALADLEALRGERLDRSHRFAMAADGGSLLLRVRRLLGAQSHAGTGPAWLAAGIVLLLAGGIGLNAQPQRPAEKAVSGAIADSGAAEAAAPVLANAAPAPAASPVQAAPGVAPAIAAVAAAVAPQSHVSISSHSDDSTGTWIWSNNGEKLEVTYQGTFDFTDDDADLRELSPGGSLKISDGAWLGRHSVELANRTGQIERRYYVNGSERPYEPEGRQWLHDHLPRFVRNTGIAAPSRVARMLKAGGPSAVLGEIARVDSIYVKGIYYRELFTQATLTGDQYTQVVTQAGRELHGADYELASLLIAISDKLPNDANARASYFGAAAGLSSDYETRRVYAAMLRRGPVDPQVLTGILDHVSRMHSDYDRSELLRQLLAQQPIDDVNRAAVFRAMSSIQSDYERHRVLDAAIGEQPGEATLVAALAQVATMHSAYDTSVFLQQVLKRGTIENSARQPFFRAVATLASSYERGQVLKMVVDRADASHDTLKEALASARVLGSYERSQVLIAAAAHHEISGDLRDAYVAAADSLGTYEQGQVMTALVRSERRR